MEKPQSSFIPKKENSSGPAYKASGSIFSFFATLIFVVAFVASLGVFVYEKYLSGRIAKMENSLTMARQALQPELIKELSRSDSRIVSAKELIDKHITLSSFFEFLQINTLQSVRFNGFTFISDENGKFAVTMKGEARSYATVALQASIFSGDSGLIDPQFSGLDLNEDGMVVFSFKTGVSPSLISYREQFRSLPVQQSLPAIQDQEVVNFPDDSGGLGTPTPSTSGAVNQTN